MPAFRFRDRGSCACGEALEAEAHRVTKQTAWGDVSFLQCRSCGSFAQCPEIEPDDLSAWYDSDAYQGSSGGAGAGYHNYLADEDARIAEARARAEHDLLPLLSPGSRVLEIGAATGSQLVPLREAGHVVSGIDISSRFVEFGRIQHGLDLQCRDFLQMEQPAEPFDLILMLGTVSNLTDPQAHMDHAAAMLKPGGMLILNLPVADSLVARLYGERFWMFTPSVNTFYSRRGIARLLDRSGFSITRMRIDRQRPSFGKLAHHLKLPGLNAIIRSLKLGEARLPFGMPIPGVMFVEARRR